jgi:glycosyltransferase involved in cell wall biosynthesis
MGSENKRENRDLLFSGSGRMGNMRTESDSEVMDPNLRIAINALTLPRNLAGTGFYLRQLLDHMTESEPGARFTVFTNLAAADSLGESRHVSIRAIDAGTLFGKALWPLSRLPFRLLGFDLVHSIGNVGLPYSPIPQVVTIHDLCQRMVPDRFGLAKRMYLNAGQSWSAWSVDKAIAVSESTRTDLVRFHPGYESKTVTIHSASKFAESGSESESETETDSGSRRREGFLFVGTLEPGKRLDFALEALACLKQQTGVTKILSVVGARGWKLTHLPDQIDRLGIGNQVEFLGYLSEEELRERYRRAECLIFPSIYEGFGLPILEAQSQGCPVVSADNSSLREVGGEGCRYFATQDLPGLTELLRQAVSDPEGFQSISRAGFANSRRFDWRRTAEATLKVYRDCLKR